MILHFFPTMEKNHRIANSVHILNVVAGSGRSVEQLAGSYQLS